MTLTRRDFIGAAVATATTTHLMQGAYNLGVNLPANNAEWMNRGLIDGGGTHEPYIFVVRRGGRRLDAKETCDYQQSEELIKKLKEHGVEVFHTHLYKGFGMEAEREGMEETRKAVEIAHRLGMKADVYIQWNTLMYETFFVEQPKAVDWIQRDVSGLPILLPYGYQQSYRYRPCFANQQYLNYLRLIVEHAIVQVKADFIHFDNFDLNAEPDSCHCPACVSGFRRHLKTKYTPALLRERFGFERIDYVTPPQWNMENPPEKMQIIYDPVFQEWIDFRCQLMADALKQMYECASSLNREVGLEINPAGITGQNRSWTAGIDHARLLKFTKSFWSEEENVPGYHPDGRLVSKIRSYKLARAYSNVLLGYVDDDPLALAEDLAFNQTLGFVGIYPISKNTDAYIEFYLKYRDFYVGSKDAANVAVLRSYASLTYNNASAQLCAIQVEQSLIQSCIPFDLVFDEGLLDLAKYKVLVLPDSECLSDEQLALLRTYVEGGGGLVAIGQSGLYDQWRRVRNVPGLQGMVQNQPEAKEYQERVGSAKTAAGVASRRQIGTGRVGYMQALEYDGSLPAHTRNFAITNDFWKRPKNWQELVELVRWAANEQLLIEVNNPEYVTANCTIQENRRRLFIHMVNYHASFEPIVKSIQMSVELSDMRSVKRVSAYAPEWDVAVPIEFSSKGSHAQFTLQEMRTYAVVAVEW